MIFSSSGPPTLMLYLIVPPTILESPLLKLTVGLAIPLSPTSKSGKLGRRLPV